MTRHFILTPVGSSGDVHPFVGVGRALRARGHEVTMITAEPFRDVSERAGLGFVPTHSAEAFEEVSRHQDLWHPQRGVRLILKLTSQALRLHYDCIAAHYQPGRSTLVGHTLGFAARLFEDANGAPAATLQLAPAVFRTLYQQPVHTPGVDLTPAPRWVKRALWWIVDRAVIDPMIVPELNRFRRELGLRPIARLFEGWLHSPQRVIGLFPDWFGPPQPDWPAQARLTGFPLYDEADQRPLSPQLEAFLADGDPPVVFTPGSANRAAAAFFEAAVEAVERIGSRALLLTPFREQVPAALPSSVRHESYVPLSHVLPRCAAIVHHGGIGTCAQALAAGIPQLITPLSFDQPDNAARLVRLGVGDWIAPARVTVERTVRALARLRTDSRVADRCAHWRRAVRSIDATAMTCDLLEQVGRPADRALTRSWSSSAHGPLSSRSAGAGRG